MEKRVTRKDFFKEFVGLFRDSLQGVTAGRQAEDGRFILPPGIQSPGHFLENCTQCYNCVSACPHEALEVWREEESDYDGYPVIEPRRQPCYRCDDCPCISACENDTLYKNFAEKSMGTAVVDKKLCLTYQGGFCQSCITACPLSGIAIDKVFEGHPTVNEALCTGCGFCTYSCVTDPPAILIKFR